jgi:transcriptional antiterminator NusG
MNGMKIELARPACNNFRLASPLPMRQRDMAQNCARRHHRLPTVVRHHVNYWIYMTSRDQGIPDDQGCRIQPHPWFAIRVRSKHERIAAVHLRERGYEEFLPSYKTERRWSDRTKTIDQFLFPGYVFSRLNPHDRLPVLTAPGVMGLVGIGKTPSPIPEHEIDYIRTMLRSGLLISPWPFLELGQIVLIERGPLAGVEGILEQVKAKFRLVVSIGLLQRSVSTEVDRRWVRPSAKPHSKEKVGSPPPYR